MTHYLRLKSDGIMISGKTLNIDNPKLNCRLKGFSQFSPKRIILDRNLEINLKSYIARTIKNENTIIFHNSNDKSLKNSHNTESNGWNGVFDTFWEPTK